MWKSDTISTFLNYSLGGDWVGWVCLDLARGGGGGGEVFPVVISDYYSLAWSAQLQFPKDCIRSLMASHRLGTGELELGWASSSQVSLTWSCSPPVPLPHWGVVSSIDITRPGPSSYYQQMLAKWWTGPGSDRYYQFIVLRQHQPVCGWVFIVEGRNENQRIISLN